MPPGQNAGRWNAAWASAQREEPDEKRPAFRHAVATAAAFTTAPPWPVSHRAVPELAAAPDPVRQLAIINLNLYYTFTSSILKG